MHCNLLNTMYMDAPSCTESLASHDNVLMQCCTCMTLFLNPTSLLEQSTFAILQKIVLESQTILDRDHFTSINCSIDYNWPQLIML